MPQPNRKPCSSLEDCRKIVAKIEAKLDGTPALFFTAAVLNGYEQSLIKVITEVRNASKEVAEQCLRSRDAVLNHLREARKPLGAAIVQLNEKGNKGKTKQFFGYLDSCRSNLEQALKYWL